MRLSFLSEAQDQETAQAAGRTAISRKDLSVPAKWLEGNGFLTGRILDYGCGRGGDTERLVEMGYDIEGFDPVHGPAMPDGPFDTVMCNYVLNVVDPDTEAEIIKTISSLLTPAGVGYLCVRNDTKAMGPEGKMMGKGSRQTYQRDVHIEDLPWAKGTSGFRMYLLGGNMVDWDGTGWEDA